MLFIRIYSRVFRFLIGGLFVSFVGTVSSAEAASVDPEENGMPAFVLGIGTHMGKQFRTFNDETILLRLKDAGVQSFRDEIYWQQVEGSPGDLRVPAYAEKMIDFALSQGIEPLIVLGYGNRHYDGGGYPIYEEARAAYIRYARFLVEHFHGRVKVFEIWNEWDMALGIPRKKGEPRVRTDPEQYADFVAEVYSTLKPEFPDVTFIAGGHAMFSLHDGDYDPDHPNSWERQRGWFDEVLSYGLIENCDGLSMHSYVKAIEDPEHWSEWMTELQERYASRYNNGNPVDMYVTEVGWFTHSAAGVSHRVQADYIARLYLLARTHPDIKGLWYFNFANDVFGVSHGAGSPKPAYWALSDVATVVSQGEYLGRIDVGNSNIYILRFRMPDGSEQWAAWSRDPLGYRDRRYNSPVTGYYKVMLQNEDPERTPLQIQMAGMGPYSLYWGAREKRYTDKMDLSVGNLTLGPRPQILSGDLASVEILSVEPTEIPEPGEAKLQDSEGLNQGLEVN